MTLKNFSRRTFLKGTGLAVGMAAGSGTLPFRVHAAEANTIKIALVGAGGRGRGAAINALSTAGLTQLVAVADVFADRANASSEALVKQFAEQPGKVDLPAERRFSGFDAYKKAINCLDKGDVVLLATCPGFRPLHVEYAVSKGINVFMEKPFATDSPGTRRIQAAAKLADEKNIKIACGLMWRHCKAREETVARIHDGAIGQLIHLRGFRMHGPFNPPKPKPGQNEIEYQIRYFHGFDWAGGNVFIDYCIHNIDVACWAKGALPVSCIALGGRSVPDIVTQAYDTYYHEYTFPDGTHLTSHGRYRNKCFNMYSDFAHGTKGSAVLMDNLSQAKTRLYSDQTMLPDKQIWAFSDKEPNPYQVEHDLFFDAIRNDKPYNEGHRAAEANFAALLGRAALNSGQIVTWDQIVTSELSLCPNIDTLTFESEAPVKPNPQGGYPYAIPGEGTAF
ncbi:MAG: Gfo/Idh/MocA family oxidoreductase [Planctomycetaceae bacterium]|nr:Gfo/Idh/MocA family oxidoreductase [Planctomycetaceae bacterium]